MAKKEFISLQDFHRLMRQYTLQKLHKDIAKIFKNAINATNMQSNDEFSAVFTDADVVEVRGLLKD